MSKSDEPNSSKHKTEYTADISFPHIPRADRRDDAHTNRIYSLRATPNFLVTGSYDRTVRVWSKSDRALALPPLTGHQSSVLVVEVSEELDLVCSGDGLGQVFLWSLSNGNLLSKANAHDVSVFSFSREARNLVSTSRDKTAKLWQILGGGLEQMRLEHRYTLAGHEWPVLASQIHSCHVITTSKDSVRIWSLEDGSCLDVISSFSSISEFEIIPKSERLQVVTACTDNQVRIYDLTDKKEIACLSGHIGVARIVKLFVSPSMPGYKIVSAGYDGTVRIWALEAEKEQWQCVHIFSFSDHILTPFGDEAEAVEIEGEEFLSVEVRAKRVFDMQIDGTIAYVVGEGAEIVAFDLDKLVANHIKED